MSKRPHRSPAPALELWERLKAAAFSPGRRLLREIFESSDTSAIAAAVAAKLSGGSSSSPDDSKRRKKAYNRPCRSLPAETFLEVVLFADRDTLDGMQLVCSFLFDFIREREHAHLALRGIQQARIGRIAWKRSYAAEDFDVDGWLPLVEVWYKKGATASRASTVSRLTSGLRMAFCESVCVNLYHRFDGTPDAAARWNAFNDVCGMVFDGFVASNTFAGTLNIILHPRTVEWAVRAIETFKSVKNIRVRVDTVPDLELSAETFLISAAQHGVRRVEFEPMLWHDVRVNAAAALSFGFAQPTAGGDRGLLGIECVVGSDFLAQVKQKAIELNETRDVDFNFKLAKITADIDSVGFEQYQHDDGRTWRMNDLENHLNVKVKQTEEYEIEIHVSSSA